jgi:acetyl esterase/lipase
VTDADDPHLLENTNEIHLHKCPGAHDEAVDAYKYVAKNAEGWGLDPAKIGIMGESAGGNLAVATAIAAHEQNLQKPVAIVSVYPVATSTTIINAVIDPLKSDGDMLADKMRVAGVEVTYKLYTGVTHEFFGMDAVVAKAKKAQDFEARDFSVAQLRVHWSRSTPL